MLRDLDLPDSLSYKSGTDHEPMAFFLDAFQESREADLLMGYYSSTAINVLALGFAKFIAQGGRLRIIINHVVSQQDKDLLTNYTHIAPVASEPEVLYGNVSHLHRDLSAKGIHFFSCLAYLLKVGRVQIRAIRPKATTGISHYKRGTFSDGRDRIHFNGSCNFTATALLENLEAIDIDLSWEARAAKFTDFDQYFESLFEGRSQEAELLPAEDLEVAIRDQFGDKTLEELLRSEEILLRDELRAAIKERHRRTLEKALRKMESYKNTPRFPYPQGPREYQVEALNNWKANNCQGIFAMATGTGKTLTALNCLLDHYQSHGSYRAIILVPYKVLVDQWEREVKTFNFRNVIKVSSAYPHWKRTLDELIEYDQVGLNWDSIIICTYASFGGADFQSRLKKLDQSRLLLIADEVHNLGAGRAASALPNLKVEKRIGLSATPKRVYDEEGSTAIDRFFNDKEPYTYSFLMERAIKEEILCGYEYFPIVVNLTEAEMAAYQELSDRLAKLYHQLEARPELKKQFEMLLLERKRIIHKAENKLGAFREIVNELNRKGELKYTLVFAPEGLYAEDAEILDSFPEIDSEDAKVIDLYARVIRQEAPETTVDSYTSTTEGREHILQSFTEGSIDVLLSMKCLDEGVDIPRTQRAIFCSSTANPRQFVQRRGRILRKHPAKHFATIFDLVVVPWVGLGSPSFEVEQKLVRTELVRVVQFAFMARNSEHSREALRDVCAHYDLNLDTIHRDLTQPEE